MVLLNGVGPGASLYDAHCDRKRLGGQGTNASNLIGFLLRDKPASNLGGGFSGNDGFSTGAHIAAHDAIEIERGSQPVTLEQIIARLSGARPGSDRRKVGCLIKWDGSNSTSFSVSDRADTVVETRNCDRAIGRVELCEYPYQRLNRIGEEP
jgi:hypothetical protein